MEITAEIGKIIEVELVSGTKVTGRILSITKDEIILFPVTDTFAEDPHGDEIHIINNAIAMWHNVTSISTAVWIE